MKFNLLFLSIFLMIAACGDASKTNKSSEPDPNASDIIFIDLFNSSESIPDPQHWKLCTYANNAWSQHFEHVDGYENVKIEDGYLKLKASKEEGVYKNGGIRTTTGFPVNTRVEVKARLTKQVRGGFPAIWQMPVDAPGWPRGGEIDLFEWVQGTPSQIYQTIHTLYANGPGGSAGVTNPNPDMDFDVTVDHIYGVDRTDNELIFYVDGQETWRYENMHLEDEETALQFPFNKYSFDIILNFSLGGTINGNPTWAGTIHDEDLPGEMWVDWVKVTKL